MLGNLGLTDQQQLELFLCFCLPAGEDRPAGSVQPSEGGADEWTAAGAAVMASGTADAVTSFQHCVQVLRCVCGAAAAADGAGGVSAEQNHLNVGEHGAWAAAMNQLGILPVGLSRQQLLPGTSRERSPRVCVVSQRT